MMASVSRLIVLVVLMSSSITFAATTEPGSLFEMSLEDLFQTRIVTHSFVEEKWIHVPAAVSVVSHEDVDEYGANLLAETLRYIPGMHVAQLDAMNWAIGARGFNS